MSKELTGQKENSNKMMNLSPNTAINVLSENRLNITTKVRDFQTGHKRQFSTRCYIYEKCII